MTVGATTCTDHADSVVRVETKFSMIALDLDGTLLRSDHTVSDETVAYLQKLHHQGMKVIIATGRAAPTTYTTVRRLNLPYEDGIPVVCSNGAKGMLCHPLSRDDSEESPSSVSVKTTQLFVTPVPKDITARVIQLAKELQYVTQYYWGEEILANPFHASHYELTEMYIELTGSKTIYVKDDFADVIQTKGEPSKLLVLCPKEQLDDLFARFEQEFASAATIVYGSPGYFIEVLHKDVCKGNGLKCMCEHLKIPVEQCIAFGDGDNDREFIQYSGLGVAMKNARPVIKNAARVQADYTNNEDGVRKTLEAFERQGLLRLEP